MNLVKAYRQFYALRKQVALDAVQARRMLRANLMLDEEPGLEETFKALKKLVSLGHLSVVTDPDTEGTAYQITPSGLATYEAGK